MFDFIQDAPRFVADLVKPALGCFTDSDQRIRYYACEALYNICKVTRGAILAYFNDIFDGLSKVSNYSVVGISSFGSCTALLVLILSK